MEIYVKQINFLKCFFLFKPKQIFLYGKATAKSGKGTVLSQDTVTGDKNQKRVVVAGASYGTAGFWIAT